MRNNGNPKIWGDFVQRSYLEGGVQDHRFQGSTRFTIPHSPFTAFKGIRYGNGITIWNRALAENQMKQIQYNAMLYKHRVV